MVCPLVALPGRLGAACVPPCAAMDDHPEDLREQGNVRFKAGDWAGAEELYSRAIALDASSAAALGNRAAARLKLGRAAAVRQHFVTQLN